MAKKYTVVGRYEQGQTFAEWIEAKSPRDAIREMCELAAVLDIIAVFEGFHKDLMPPEKAR